MQVAVVLRLVPELSGEVEIAEDGKDIDREMVDMRLNEFDDHALEVGDPPQGSGGATVIALALTGEGVDRMLQSAIARGADRAVKISHGDEGGLSSRAAAPVIADAVRQLCVDLVLTGIQTPEDLFGQLAPYSEPRSIGLMLARSAACSVWETELRCSRNIAAGSRRRCALGYRR